MAIAAIEQKLCSKWLLVDLRYFKIFEKLIIKRNIEGMNQL
jgi:hypothetical protein